MPDDPRNSDKKIKFLTLTPGLRCLHESNAKTAARIPSRDNRRESVISLNSANTDPISFACRITESRHWRSPRLKK